jgi:short-subunit dehydrogenase
MEPDGMLPLWTFSKMRIEGKVALITGASRGIGAACAAEFRARGARLSLVARSEQGLAEAGGPEDLITAGDIADEAVRARAVERTIERFGRIDILVNNAAAGLYLPAWDTPPDMARRLFELNFLAPLGMARLVAPHMRAQGAGAIVNVASVAAKATLPWLTLYSASKAALCALTDGLRVELAPCGIHAMAVCPGYVRTTFQQNALAGEPPESVRKSRRFTITAETCARAIARGVEREARTVMTPPSAWLLVAAARLFPRQLDARFAAMLHRV